MRVHLYLAQTLYYIQRAWHIFLMGERSLSSMYRIFESNLVGIASAIRVDAHHSSSFKNTYYFQFYEIGFDFVFNILHIFVELHIFEAKLPPFKVDKAFSSFIWDHLGSTLPIQKQLSKYIHYIDRQDIKRYNEKVTKTNK